MKARLIKNPQKGLILLCEDGTIMQPDMRILYQILINASKRNVTFDFDGQQPIGRWIDEYPEMTLYPGKDVASIADSGAVILFDFTPFKVLVSPDFKVRNYMSSSEYAQKNNVSQEMVKVYCRQGRLRGAVKTAGNWVVPADAEWPIDPQRSRIGQTRGVSRPRKKSSGK